MIARRSRLAQGADAAGGQRRQDQAGFDLGARDRQRLLERRQRENDVCLAKRVGTCLTVY